MSEEEERPTVVLVALLANVGMAVAKFVAFAFTGSSGLLAESLHSVADTSNQLLLLLGRRRSRFAETPEHPFGFGAERYFWAFLVSIIFFLLGGAFSLYEGITELADPEPLDHVPWAVGVLLVGMVFEGLSLRTAVKEARREGVRDWIRYIRRSKEPDRLVVLLEDSAAEIGLLIALVGVVLTVLTGDPIYDAAASIGVGLVLAGVAYVLAREMRSLLIGEGAITEVEQDIREIMERDRHVEAVVGLRTLHLGPDALLIAARLELDEELRHDEVAVHLDGIERTLRAEVPATSYVYLEPQLADVPDPGLR